MSNGQINHQLDAMRNLADGLSTMVARYRSNLIESGFTKEEATDLVKTLQMQVLTVGKDIFQYVFMKKSGD